jgi:hypothetical protein
MEMNRQRKPQNNPMLNPHKIASRSIKNPPDDREQSKAFIEKAREIGADEDRSMADELLGGLAKMKPEPRAKGRGRPFRARPPSSD